MHIIQAPLLAFNDFFKLDYSDRLTLVLEVLNAEKLLRAIEADSPDGRKGYPARVLWSALIAGVVYRLPTIAELIRHLEINPYLRMICGIQSEDGVPSAPTFSRFLCRLVKHQELLDECIDDLVRRFAALAPGFGESVVEDSTDVHACSRGKKRGASDPDASWGAKGSKEGGSKGRKEKGKGEGKAGKRSKEDLYWWFGYKVHLLVDTRYEVPIAAIVSTASEADTTYLRPLLDKRDQLLPEVPLKVNVGDGAYDNTENIKAVTGRGALPVIPFNPGQEKAPPGITNTLGTPLCPVALPMTYWGRDGSYLKVRIGLNLLVMLAIAVGMAERHRLKDCRRLLSCAA